MVSSSNNKIYKTIDLCAGIGGIRRGFEMTGQFTNVLSAEIDPSAVKTYIHLFGDNPSNDITSAIFKKRVEETAYDVLLAGFPCQAFSSVGKKLGFKDLTRGTIFFHIAEIIKKTKPKAIFLENVQNIVSHDKGNTIKVIIDTLELELGYKIVGVTEVSPGVFSYSPKTLIRNTKDFGLPQNRPRTYLIGFSKDFFGPAILRIAEKALPSKGKETIFKNVDQVLEHNVDDKYYMASGYLETLKRHKITQKNKGNGFGYCVVNDGKRKSRYANTLLATGGSGKERNLVYQPKEGVGGKKIPSKHTSLNTEGIRVMTPNEWGRLQGFIDYAFLENGVDNFSFPSSVTDGQKYKQFGNSVSIPVIKTMALFMLDCFNLMLDCKEKKIYDFVISQGSVSRNDVMNHFGLSYQQSNYILNKMLSGNYIKAHRVGRTQKFCKISSNT